MACDYSGINLIDLPSAQYVTANTSPLATRFIYNPDCALVIIGSAGPVTAGTVAPGKRRHIRVEELRELLREQGNPWADELADALVAVDDGLAEEVLVKKKKKTKKLAKVFEEIIDEIPKSTVDSVNWGAVVASLLAAQAATRATPAIKHAETALSLFHADPDDEEIILLLYG